MKLAFKLSSAALLVAASISAAQAGGFMLTEQSVANQGRAFAGAGIVGDDLSAVWFNPAGMTLQQGTAAQIGATLVSLNLKVKSNDGSQTENGRDKEMPIPSAYFIHQLSPDMWLGLGITTPFGLSTAYNDNWGPHADQANHPGGMSERGYSAEVKVFNFNPSLAWKATDKLSVGAGVSIEYATAKYRTKTYDPDMQKTVEGLLGQGAQVPATVNEANAGLKADGWAWGFNFGFMWEPTDTVRLGLAYRSSINHKVNGDTDITFPGLNTDLVHQLPPEKQQALQGLLGQFSGVHLDGNGLSTLSNGTATVKAPQTVMLTGTWKATKDLRLSGLVRWADWSSFDTLNIHVNSDFFTAVTNGKPIGMTVENHWKDTWMFALGADYDINEQFTVRGGIGYETSAIDDPRYRSPVIPDMNRLMLSAGLTWRPTKNLQGDFAFTYLKGIGNSDVYAPTRTGSHKMADYEYKDKWGEFSDMHAYMFGAQMVYHF